MNCAVVDITNKGRRDTQASAAKALSRYPELFVANLANINSCKTQETTDVIFDNPGKEVTYGNGDNAFMQPSFRIGQCTGKSSKNAGSKDTSSSDSGGGGGGQWTPPAQSPSKPDDCATKIRDGQWHPECYGGNSRTTQQEQRPAQQRQPQQTKQNAPKPGAKKPKIKKPNTAVQHKLDEYLGTLYARGLVRRSTASVADYAEHHSQKKEHSVQPHIQTHTKNCQHKATGYPSGSHYHNNEDLDPYPEDGTDYSNKNVYSTQDSQHHKDPDSASNRVSRQKRWTSYVKRVDGSRIPIPLYRRDESAYYQSQASTQASTQDFTRASTETSAQTSDDPSVQTSWNDMPEPERFQAFLRRMVELSTNIASLIKYAAASTVNIPYYPPSSAYDGTEASTAQSAQNVGAVRRHARRGVLPSTGPLVQVYPGPSVGSISAPGDATDADDGFRAWFPDLVQGLVTKRQLVDPITSEASAEAGDSINFFDALLAAFWKILGDPFNLYSDEPDTDPVPAPEPESEPGSETIPLVLGEPDLYSGQNDFPDFDIPDLDGHYTFPPQILAPEPPIPTLLPERIEEHGTFPNPDDSEADLPPEAEDASGRRPRPGVSLPLIPYPLSDNFTGPYPANATRDAAFTLLNATAPAGNDTAPLVELQPYHNQTLGELVNETMADPDTLGPSHIPDAPEGGDVAPGLTPVPSDSSDDLPPIDQPSDETNPLQEAADQAEEGVTVPQQPVVVDPNALESVADALPWFMGPGPVITNVSSVPPQ